MNALVKTALATVIAAPALAQSHSLELGPGSRLEFPHNAVMNTGSTCTVEYWVRSTTAQPLGSIAWSRYAPSAEHKELTVRADGSVDFLYAGSPWFFNGGADFGAPAGTVSTDLAWHHVAFVRRATGTWEVFVDGASALNAGPGGAVGAGCWLTCNVINANTTTLIGSFGGWQIDELRVSSVERYSSSFVPLSRFMSDSDTAMLLHFDEGTGSQVGDHGIASQAGVITGGYQWSADVEDCGSFIPYCTSGVSVAGCQPSISGIGAPSSTAASGFQMRVSSVPGGRYGIFFYGSTPTAQTWALGSTSYQCVLSPLSRASVMDSGGTLGACDGVLSLDWNTWRSANGGAHGSPFHAGQVFYAQGWYRDPGAAAQTNLSDGLRFVLCD